MASITRALASDTLAEIIKQHTRPVGLVRINIGDDSVFLSESKEITWNGDIFVDGSVRVGQFRWNGDGEQVGELYIMNDRSAASALVLGNTLQDVEVLVYQTYLVDSITVSMADYRRITAAGDVRITSASDVRVTEGGTDVEIHTELFTTPELLVRGILDGATIGYDETTLTVYTSRLRTEYVPNRFYSPENGFNHLPRVGTVVYWGQEKFVLEAES